MNYIGCGNCQTNGNFTTLLNKKKIVQIINCTSQHRNLEWYVLILSKKC